MKLLISNGRIINESKNRGTMRSKGKKSISKTINSNPIKLKYPIDRTKLIMAKVKTIDFFDLIICSSIEMSF